jgi:hypothetical protein
MSPPGEAYAETAKRKAKHAVQTIFFIPVSTNKKIRPGLAFAEVYRKTGREHSNSKL